MSDFLSEVREVWPCIDCGVRAAEAILVPNARNASDVEEELCPECFEKWWHNREPPDGDAWSGGFAWNH